MKSSIKLSLAVTAITLGSLSTAPTASAMPVDEWRNECGIMGGVWRRTAFDDWDTGARITGFSCENRRADGDRTRNYYDPVRGYNHRCTGNREVRICEQ
jgi:hypothetical protein